jgi:hypothetical protein
VEHQATAGTTPTTMSTSRSSMKITKIIVKMPARRAKSSSGSTSVQRCERFASGACGNR